MSDEKEGKWLSLTFWLPANGVQPDITRPMRENVLLKDQWQDRKKSAQRFSLTMRWTEHQPSTLNLWTQSVRS